jgi:hypothetical protein
VSYYALFQGWLLLSQPPGCFSAPTTFPTKHPLGGLSRRSGLFPSWQRRLAPVTSLVGTTHLGIHGLIGVGNQHLAPSPFSALPPRQLCVGEYPHHQRLYLHTFRGEPAISGFDWNFSSIHRSSPSFATLVSSSLDAVLPALHSAHG